MKGQRPGTPKNAGNGFVGPLNTSGVPCKECARLGKLCARHRSPEEAAAAGVPFCGAPSATGTCRHKAGYRTDHVGYGRCYRHGGCSPNGKKAAAKAKAVEAVITLGLPREINPHDALLEEVWRTAGHVKWLESRVRELDPAALVWGETKRTREMGPTLTIDEDGQGNAIDPTEAVVVESKIEEQAAVSIWMKMYSDERKHLVEVCKAAIGCGIAERQVRIAEEHGAIIARVIGGVLGDLGIDQSGDVVRTTVRRHLMLISEQSDVSIAPRLGS